MGFYDDDGLETEEELRESYPFIYGGNEKPMSRRGLSTRLSSRSLLIRRAKLAEERRRVEQLAKQGMSQRAIAKELGVGPTTINRCVKVLKQKEAADL